MAHGTGLLWCIGMVGALCLAPAANADEVRLNLGGGTFDVPVVSFKARPYLTVVKQQADNSCGSAAVATLLTYHFEYPLTEREAFIAMWEAGDKDKIKKEGFSLLEMKLYLESLGYKADGFEVGLDRIERVGLPVIVLIETRGYKHFVVVKGARAGHVLVGDPARGMLKMSEEQFLAEWKNGLAFAIHNANEIGRRYFDTDEEWKRLPPSPLGSAVSRATLASFSVMLPGITESFFH